MRLRGLIGPTTRLPQVNLDVAVFMLGLLTSGWLMVALDDRMPLKWSLFELHESVGFLVPLLLWWRLGFRRCSNDSSQQSKRWVLLARLNAGLLLALALLMPVSGYLQAAPYGVEFFGWQIPAPEQRFYLAGIGLLAHIWLATLALFLLTLHLVGALRHLLGRL